MTVDQSLLDLLSIQMGCMYLSDLRFLSPEQRRYLARRLELLIPRQEDIREWNDALDYEEICSAHRAGADPFPVHQRLCHGGSHG